jgi:cytochrome c-type biogenesis protein CcmE
MSKGIQIALGGLLVVGLLGWYGWKEVRTGSFVYYRTVDEFRAAPDPGRPVRVHGYVTPGSIQRDVKDTAIRFRIQEKAPHAGGTSQDGMDVLYDSLETPDMFKDGAEVVVEGRLARPNGVFHATNVLAKCPSKFQARAQASL